ncbi:MAG TPA: hypothetical protein VJN18_14125 [Polyangiaceae bacterium]|nr:hypothetical protein [Polyangiaceae bacterium]
MLARQVGLTVLVIAILLVIARTAGPRWGLVVLVLYLLITLGVPAWRQRWRR